MVETERLITEGHALKIQEHNLHNELVADLYGTLRSPKKNAGRDSLIDFLGEVE